MVDYRKRNRARLSEYAVTHRVERKAIKHAYIARRRGALGRYSAQEFRDLCSIYRGECAYCGYVRPLEADHAIPLSRGGSNFIDNILPACRYCNASKKDRTVEEFRAGMIYRRAPRTPLVPTGYKKCPGCNTIKPLSDYWKNKYHPMGVLSRCKICAYKVTKAWLARPENRAKHRASARAWYALNKNKKK